MAVKFYLENGTVTDIIALPIPLFVARHPDEVFELLTVSMPDAATGNQDIEKVQRFFKERPWLLPAFQAAMSTPASSSFAQTPYHPLHAFRFVNRAGESVYGRSAGEGLRWIAHGFSALGLSDNEILDRESIVYDSLYAECQQRAGSGSAIGRESIKA